MDFEEKVFKITKKVPKGKISTYKEIARALKIVKACRAVGNALNNNKSRKVPCHRIIRSDGFVGGFNKGEKEKIKRLKKEGIKITNNKIDLNKYLFKCKY